MSDREFSDAGGTVTPMGDMKDRMIEAFERGECSYEESYDYVRESLADAADRRRKAERESGGVLPPTPPVRGPGRNLSGPDRLLEEEE